MKPVPLLKCQKDHCGGVTFSVPGSRLEDFLGHELFRCEKCKQLYKVTPSDDTPWEVVEFVSFPSIH